MATLQQKKIIKVFKKQNFTLGPDTIAFLDDVCIQHAVPPDQLEAAMQYFVDEYAKQDDATMKVSKAVLERVFDAFQSSQDTSMAGGVYLDPDANLHVLNAFDLPLWQWSVEKIGFEKAAKSLSLTADAESRVLALRNRIHIVRQVILRNEHFTASALPSRDRDSLLELRSTKDTLGRAGSDFLLFGMITHSKEGQLSLEDLDGHILLDMSAFRNKREPGGGFFTEGCLALVEGTYTDHDTLQVREIGHPPCERRGIARSVHGHIDLWGRGFVTPMEEQDLAARLKEEHPSLAFFCFSDLWLDHPETLSGLRRIFEACIENAFIPKVFILCGNFSSKGIAQINGREILRYQENFDELADLIISFPIIARTAHFILVPGPLDLTESPSSIYPRKPIFLPPASRLKSRVPNIHLATNPCRILFCGQEIVVFRDDLMARVMRNSVLQRKEVTGDILKKYLVQTIVDQGHLAPFTLEIQPTYWDFDHSLRLYPMPSTLVLADRYERYELTYEGCHVFNPGSFLGTACGFSTYYPASGRSEPSEIPSTYQLTE